MYCALLLMHLCAGMREQWRKSDILAQASGSRLSESVRNSGACASCRSGDELQFWARVHLAQARRSHLSEKTQKCHCSTIRALV